MRTFEEARGYRKNSIFILVPPHAKKCGYLEGIIPVKIGGNKQE
jgi:hypothetical protein